MSKSNVTSSLKWFPTVFNTYTKRTEYQINKKNFSSTGKHSLYKKKNKMYLTVFPLVNTSLCQKIIDILGFFNPTFFKLSPYTFTLFWQQKLFWLRFQWVKIRKKTGILKNVSKKYIEPIFSVRMDKVIYDKFKLI